MWRALVAALMVSALVAVACGGDDDAKDGGGADPTATPGSGAMATATTAKALAPAELGDAIGDLYVAALTDLAALMKDRPAPAELKPKVEALKESYIKRLFELGRQRKALSAADRSAVDSKLRTRINTVPSDLFKAYSEGQSHYQKAGDAALAKLIADFNIITQYADFELLKKQEPAEATRLGVD